MTTDALIIKGDCLKVMAGLPDGSIDAIVTDPPYGLSAGPAGYIGEKMGGGFMGKNWDSGVPGENFWREALRVAKPGCHILAAGGTRTYHRLTCAIEDAGWEIRDCIMWLYGSGFPKSHNLKDDWQGWGTALKPAYEPFILARKPLDGTVASNVQRHGCGGLNVDGCRVGTDDDYHDRTGIFQKSNGTVNFYGGFPNSYKRCPPASAGRWPANVIHDGSDEVVAGFAGTERFNRPGKRTLKTSNERGSFHLSGLNGPFETVTYDDTGNNSRFFYCAKASPSERGENHHPTVKPIDLMKYLCRLITPPGGLILDPFCGSGSTGVAAMREGFNFIGIELNHDYAEIARRRIDHERNKTPLFSDVI